MKRVKIWINSGLPETTFLLNRFCLFPWMKSKIVHHPSWNSTDTFTPYVLVSLFSHFSMHTFLYAGATEMHSNTALWFNLFRFILEQGLFACLLFVMGIVQSEAFCCEIRWQIVCRPAALKNFLQNLQSINEAVPLLFSEYLVLTFPTSQWLQQAEKEHWTFC